MKYNTSVITYFVIPSGATSGQRIVFDGVLGEIDLFNAADQLVGQWKPSQFGIFAGTPNVGQSIVLKPNSANDSNRAAIELRVTTGGGAAIIDATDDGAGRANLNMFSPVYTNAAGQDVATTCQVHTAFAGLFIIGTDGNLRGGNLGLQDTSGTLAAYSAGASPVLLSTVAVTTTPDVLITPDQRETTRKTISAKYFTTPDTAALTVDGQSWTNLTLANSWVAATDGSATPSYWVMPDGTLQFRGSLKNGTTSDGTQVASFTSILAPSPFRTFAVSALGNAICQLNVNANGTMVIFGLGGVNRQISLDGIRTPITF